MKLNFEQKPKVTLKCPRCKTEYKPNPSHTCSKCGAIIYGAKSL